MIQNLRIVLNNLKWDLSNGQQFYSQCTDTGVQSIYDMPIILNNTE